MVKRIVILSCVTASTSFLSHGSTLEFLVSTDKIWNYTEWKSGADGYAIEKAGFHFNGEKAIGEKTYSVFRDKDNLEVAYLRQEGDKVYISVQVASSEYDFTIEGDGEPTQEEYLLYDFSCNVGDRFTTVGFDDVNMNHGLIQQVTVSAVETIYFEDKHYRALVLSSPNSQEPFRIVEGIGPECGLLCFPQFGNPSSGIYKIEYYLDEMRTTAGELLFGYIHGDYGGVEEKRVLRSQTDSTLYDLMGRPVANPQPGSIYLQNGRKVMVRL